MARVTIEDCRAVPSRFELILLAAQRAREIASGAKPNIERNNKDAVLALREIAHGSILPDVLRESLVRKYQLNHGVASAEDQEIGDSFEQDDIQQIQDDMEKLISYGAADSNKKSRQVVEEDDEDSEDESTLLEEDLQYIEEDS